MVSTRWIVSQIGAREHYTIPATFHQLRQLDRLYCDIWCPRMGGVLRNGPRMLRSLAARHHSGIPSEKVKAFTLAGIIRHLRVARSRTTTEKFEAYQDIGRWFAGRVARSLGKMALDPERHCFFGFDTGCLETQAILRDRGILNIVDQIDPARFEEELVFQESQRWAGWQQLPGRIPDAYFDRLSQEWQLADMVLVNSRWSREALIAQGVPAGKIIVVALAYEPPCAAPRPDTPAAGPLRVLWLGQVNLRKGIQYLIGAARLLKDFNVQFTIAGALHISRQAVDSAPASMKFIGQVTRDRIAECYRNADVFVLPTLSDGFAITQLEAMAAGLPVIATPNCGEVVTDGVDGLIVPPSSAEALAGALARLEADRPLVAQMSQAALRKATHFRPPRQALQINRAVEEYRKGARGEALQQAIDSVTP